MASESENYEGRLLAGHVLWVRDAENGGEWLPIVGLKGVPGEKGGVYIPQWDGRYLTFRYNPTSDGNPSPIALDLKGPQGERGPEGPQGKQGVRGPQGEKGAHGEDGEGALELAVQAGYEGTARAFYDALAAVVATGEKAQEAIELAKKNNHAHLFETQEEHDLWLADPQMTNTLNIGDLLFVKETAALSIWDGDNEIGFPSTATLDLHIKDKDNPHEVTADQIPYNKSEAVEVTAVINGADNWGTAWGFDLNLRSINPEAWEGRPAGTVARISRIGLQVSGSAGKDVEAYLLLTSPVDYTDWLSTNKASWKSSGEAVDYVFDPPAELPDGVFYARFLLLENSSQISVPMRVSKVSSTETPAGCDVWTDMGGLSKRTDFAPRLRDTIYTLHEVVVETVADALDARLTEAESEERYLRVDSAKTNNLQKAIRFYAHTGETPTTPDANSPFFVLGSQLKDDGSGDIKEDRWALFWAYNGFTFRQTPGSGDEFFGFARGQSYSFVRQQELDEATQNVITTDGGTVDGILRMKNPKVAADDDTAHDIALVPNANGQGLQVQFPGGSTAMIRMKTGTLATVQEVNDAIETIELTPGPQGPQGPQGETGPQGPKGDPGDDATVAIDTTMPEAPADDHVPSTKLAKTELDKKVDKDGAAVNGTLNITPVAESTTTTVATITVKGDTFYRPQLGTAQVINTDLTISFTNYLGETGIAFGSLDGKDFGTGLTARAFYASEIKDGDSQPTSSWLTPDNIYEKGQKLSDKYAAKADTYTKAEVDEKSGVKGIVDEGFTWESGGKIFSFGYTGREGESIWSRDLRFIKQSESLSIHAVTYINETEAVNDEIFENSVPLMSTFQALQDRVTALEEEVEALKQAGVPTVDPNAAPTMTSLYDLNTKENDVIQSLGQFYVEGTNLTWNVDAEDEGFFVIYNTAETACDVVMANDDPTRVIIVNRCEFVSDDEEIELVFRKRIKLEGMDNALISVKYPKPLKTRIPEA